MKIVKNKTILNNCPLLLSHFRSDHLSYSKVASLGWQHRNDSSYHIPVSGVKKGTVTKLNNLIQHVKLFYFRFFIAFNTKNTIKIITLIIFSIICRLYLFHVCYADHNSIYGINGTRAIGQHNINNGMGTQVLPPPTFTRPCAEWYPMVSKQEASKQENYTYYVDHRYKLDNDTTYRINYQRQQYEQSFAGISGSMNNELMHFWNIYRMPYDDLALYVRSLHQNHLLNAVPIIAPEPISAPISTDHDVLANINPLPFNTNLFIRNFNFHSFYNNFCNNYDTFTTQVRSAIFMIEFMKQHLPSDILPKTLAEFNSEDTNKPFNQFLNRFFDTLEPITNQNNLMRYVTLQTAIDTYVKLHISGKLNNTILFGQTFENDILNNLKNARQLFKL